MILTKRLLSLFLYCVIFFNGSSAVSFPEHQTDEEFAKEVVQVHNEHRKVHNGGDSQLKLNSELSEKAMDLAEDAARDSDNYVLKNPGPGENVLMACSTYNRALTGREVTDAWYDEICHPEFSFKNPDNKQARSFTQVVWKNSKELGVGHVVTRKEHTICTYVVAIYKPSGNIDGFYNGNVTQGSFERQKYCKQPSDTTKQIRFSITPKLRTNRAIKTDGAKQFTLNKNPRKPILNRRTLYYKIPVNFVTSEQTGSTYAVPMKTQTTHQVAADRRSGAMPRYIPLSDTPTVTDTINDENVYIQKPFLRRNQEESTNGNSLDNSDVQAEYIREQLEHNRDAYVPEQQNFIDDTQLNSLEKNNGLPLFENIQMIKPIKKTIEDDYALNKIALRVHNALRRVHSAPPLVIDAKLSLEAENYARYLAENDKFVHSKDRVNDGENLAFSCNDHDRIPSVAEAIKDWYEEVCTKDYDFRTHPALPGAAHFTQIVWKSTKRLGIGRAIIRHGATTCTYFVGRYNPSGDLIGNFRDNVPLGSFNRRMCLNLPRFILNAMKTNEETGHDIAFTSNSSPTSQTNWSEDSNSASDGQKRPTQETPVHEDLENIEKDDSQPNGSESLGQSDNGLAISEDQNGCRFWTINDQATFANEALKVHNYFRKLHGSPVLEIDTRLVLQALNAAKQICGDTTKRQNDMSIGQNVESACNSLDTRISAAETVTNWYKQVCEKEFKFGRTDQDLSTRKFTQLVWQGSKKFGIAFVTRKFKDGLFCTYVVGKYSPTGNLPGTYRQNVGRGKFSPTICNSLNTIANNVLNQNEEPVNVADNSYIQTTDHGSFYEPAAKHPVELAHHEAAKFEPFNGSMQLEVPQTQPVTATHFNGKAGRRDDSCDHFGTEGAPCREFIQNRALEIHNFLRNIHGSPGLELSPELSRSAEEFARRLLREKKIKSSHVEDGENIAIKCRKHFTVEEAVETWYKEVCDSNYDFAEEGPQSANEFTQIIWAKSRYLGIGKVSGEIDGLNCTVIVARYQPAGNTLLKYRDNVKQGDFKREICDTIKVIVSATLNTLSKSEQDDSNREGEEQETDSDNSNKELLSFPSQKQPQTGSTGKSNPADTVTEQPKNGKDSKQQNVASNTSPVKDGGMWVEDKGINPIAESGKRKPKKNQKDNQDSERKENNVEPEEDGPVHEIPKENKGINPNVGNMTSSQTLPGETQKGAKNEKKPKDLKNYVIVPILPTREEVVRFNDESLKIHNALRALHDSEKLVSSPELVNEAEKICKESISSGTVTEAQKRQITASHGQNLVIICDPAKADVSPADVIMKWYGEVCEENKFVNGVYHGQPDHFTQIVWRSSTRFGMAKISFEHKGEHCIVAVALYREPGNSISKLRENVKKGRFDFEQCKYPDLILKAAVEEDNKTPEAGPSPPTVKPTEAPLKTTAGPPASSDDVTTSIRLATSPTPSTQFTTARPTEETALGTEYQETDKQSENADETGTGTEGSNESGGEQGAYEKATLDAHNNFREIHGSPPMTLDTELSKHCEEYAKIIAKAEKLKHSDAKEGENLYYGCISEKKEVEGTVATKKWYNETCRYNYVFGQNAENDNTGHFTQVVWKESRKLGVGRVMVKQGHYYCTYIVARYYPAGNVRDQYDANVKKGRYDAEETCKNLDKYVQQAGSRKVTGPTTKRTQVEPTKSKAELTGIVDEDENEDKIAK